jgi:hypothetical protein
MVLVIHFEELTSVGNNINLNQTQLQSFINNCLEIIKRNTTLCA